VGKSTIANGLVMSLSGGELTPSFKSGISIGEGLTVDLETYKVRQTP
jgi:hypothetical protein